MIIETGQIVIDADYTCSESTLFMNRKELLNTPCWIDSLDKYYLF